MTTMKHGTYVCMVCHVPSCQHTLSSTNSIGSPDLDLRPAGMARSTLGLRIQICPHCGYVAGDISKAEVVDAAWLQSEEYKECGGIPFAHRLAKAYFRRSLIAQKQKDDKGQFIALRSAAWACDDARDQKGAAVCRKMAVEAVDKLITADPQNTGLLVMKADLMRRADMFEELIEEYRNIRLNDPPLDRILDFERTKAAAHDGRRYTIDQAYGDQ